MFKNFVKRILDVARPLPDGSKRATAKSVATAKSATNAATNSATKFGNKAASKKAKPAFATYPAAAHGIALDSLSRGAVITARTLQEAGFQAFIVGGAVRDLLLGLKPKDFDVATNATPDQVLKCFRRARSIGKRFRIIHVMYGAETVEVSTFRAPSDERVETDEEGRVLRDNVWGNQQQDAERRDFTVNALFYDPVANTVIDYHDGVADLKAKTLRMIGDPATRYREDPVRMLRATRFAAKLGFTIEPNTRAPIKELAPLLGNIPPARLFDETLKMLLSGHAVATVHVLRAEELHHGLLPLLDVILEQPLGEKFVMLALARTDERLQMGKGVSPGFLFATLLWHEVLLGWQKKKARGEHAMPALFEAMDDVIDQQGSKLAITRRYSGDMKEIWALQARFERRNGRFAFKLLEHPRFRAAYDFLLLRCESGEVEANLGEWWTTFIDADGSAREAMVKGLTPAPNAGKRRRVRGKKSSDDEPHAVQIAVSPEP